MPLFDRKPSPPVEADQWFFGKAVKGVHSATPATNTGGEFWPAYAKVTTITNEDVTIHEGDWVVMASDGIHAYSCSDAVFQKWYTARDAAVPDQAELEAKIDEKYRELVASQHSDGLADVLRCEEQVEAAPKVPWTREKTDSFFRQVADGIEKQGFAPFVVLAGMSDGETLGVGVFSLNDLSDDAVCALLRLVLDRRKAQAKGEGPDPLAGGASTESAT